MKNTQEYWEIKNQKIGRKCSTFLIAEIGNNHNGSLENAINLVNLAHESGANAVKFQFRDLDFLYGSGLNNRKCELDLGAQYTIDLLKKFQLQKHEMKSVFEYCASKNILAFCTPWDEPSVNFLEECKVDLYKIASADLTNHDLLKKISSLNKPMILSTGMSKINEIQETVNLLNAEKANFCLLHCNSTYPTPFKDVHLNFVSEIKKLSHFWGYSGHERGFYVCLAAVALGAKIVEKHFTLDKSQEGNDHKVSLLPSEFKEMANAIRIVEEALGSEVFFERHVSQGELINRENLAKSLAANTHISIGSVITESHLKIVSPGQGLQPNKKNELIGKIAQREIKKDGIFFESDLKTISLETPLKLNFSRPWGIPVRYHDFNVLNEIFKPKLVEFHLSYNDLNENIESHLKTIAHNIQLVVHAPELFESDLLLDLCSLEKSVRKTSLKEMNRVTQITRNLKKFFPSTQKPCIVTNVGGFTKDTPLPQSKRSERYALFLESLLEIDTQGVEILPQTMAPFPWHFGGQQHQNIFMLPSEIMAFCNETKMRVCLDYSHSHLVCNHFKIKMDEFIAQVGPHTAHIHLGDSKGVDGEGLQIGEGEINFNALSKLLKEHCPNASFIPEIWQGHKNSAQGFRIALQKLSGII
jgi:sialic acid synthase SpsE/endonuclease IV